jgi:hypothetical protein
MTEDLSPKEGEQDDPAQGAPPVDGPVVETALAPTKTPFYQAIHALRYQRQAIIRRIQENTGRKLLCYVAGDAAPLDRDDPVGFVDLLHNVQAGQDVNLLLHTVGGDIDVAEKLITMLRTKVGAGRLRVVVPDFAKSAGTLIAIGADAIVMSDMSELGPIDPQIVLTDGNGNRIRHSVQSYIDAYKTHAATLKKDPNDIAAAIMLGKLDPATVKLFESVMTRARSLAETLLQQGMFKELGNWSQAASALIDTNRWQSHGQMISWQDATDPKIGLTVDYLDPKSDLWTEYWQIYCLQRLAVGDQQKLFESDYASLLIESRLR